MPKFIFITGSTGSGKTTVSKEIESIIKEQGLSVTTLSLDHYYLSKKMRDIVKPENWDVPNALDQKLIIQHLRDLEEGKTINRPTYKMECSDRDETIDTLISSEDVIIVEGIFAGEYYEKVLHRNTDKFKVYVHSQQLNDNHFRKELRDLFERQKTKDEIIIDRKNQNQCFFKYVVGNQNSSDLVIENPLKPSRDLVGRKQFDNKEQLISKKELNTKEDIIDIKELNINKEELIDIIELNNKEELIDKEELVEKEEKTKLIPMIGKDAMIKLVEFLKEGKSIQPRW